MNETHNPFFLASQHYLFEVSGQVVVGYFPWRESVIVVVFDAASCGYLDADRITNSSHVCLLSVEAARQDWMKRESGSIGALSWCRVLAFENHSEFEIRLKSICRGLAIQFRDKEEARRIAVVQDEAEAEPETLTTMIDRILKQMKIENKTSPVVQEYTNYNYPMEA